MISYYITCGKIDEVEQQDQDQPKSPERRRFLANLMILSIAGVPALVKLCERLIERQEETPPLEVKPVPSQAKTSQEVVKQKQHYEAEPGIQQRIENTLRWEKLASECVQDLKERGLTLEPVIEKTILPLIFVESGGDPHGLIYLNNLYQSYPEPSLAIWAYHLGAGNMIHALRTYLVSTAGLPEAEVWQILGKEPTPEDPVPGTNILVRENKVNAVALLNSLPVKKELQKRQAFNDQTEYYFYRVAAAAEILSSKT